MLVDSNSSAPPSRAVDPIRGLCHDMRQPLAAILMLAETAGSDPQRRLELIADQAQWLARLVDDVLVDAAGDEPTWSTSWPAPRWPSTRRAPRPAVVWSSSRRRTSRPSPARWR